MPDLKLQRLPDRTPVKITISTTPELAADLAAYAQLYREAYGREEPVAELIPAMLSAFLESDRAFAKARRAGAVGTPSTGGDASDGRALELARGGGVPRRPPNSLRAYVRAGRVPGMKIGRDWRFLETDLVGWIRANYPDPARMQPSADDKEATWHSGTVQDDITSSSQLLTERSLDALLERPTGRRPRNITTS